MYFYALKRNVFRDFLLLIFYPSYDPSLKTVTYYRLPDKQKDRLKQIQKIFL